MHAWTQRLTQSFSSLTAAAGVYFAAQTTSLAQQQSPATNDVPAEAALPQLRLEPGSAAAATEDSRRGLLNGLDDYFARNSTVHGSHNGIWVSPAARIDVSFIAPSPGSFFQVSREYVQVQPLRWDWLGRATGVDYGLQCALGNGLELGGRTVTFQGGFDLGAYQNPDPRLGCDERAGAFVEAARDLRVCGAPARLVLGTSFGAVSGPDLGRHAGERIYSELDFPHLFGGKVATGDPLLDDYSLGRFSGALRAACTPGARGGAMGQVGFYYNHLEEGGKSASFSFGPDIGYAEGKGMTLGLRLRVAPKFW